MNDLPENTSGLQPLGRAILVAPFEPKRKASLIALPDDVLAKERQLDLQVRVIEMGAACYPDEPFRCSPGDIVYVAKMSGVMAKGPADGLPYRLVNDRDVFCKVTHLEEV